MGIVFLSYLSLEHLGNDTVCQDGYGLADLRDHLHRG